MLEQLDGKVSCLGNSSILATSVCQQCIIMASVLSSGEKLSFPHVILAVYIHVAKTLCLANFHRICHVLTSYKTQ